VGIQQLPWMHEEVDIDNGRVNNAVVWSDDKKQTEVATNRVELRSMEVSVWLFSC
jgi:hypothetical protein